jgi:hypothetical protein
MKRRKNSNKLDSETSRPWHNSTISSKPEKNKSKNAEFSSKTKRRNTPKTWRSRPSSTTKKWRKWFNPARNRKKKENRNTTNVKNRPKNEREKYNNNNASKPSKRKWQSSASKRKDGKWGRITNDKWRSTNLISRKNWNQRKKVWLGFNVKSNKKCLKNITRISSSAQTRSKTLNASWRYSNTKSKNWWIKLRRRWVKQSISSKKGNSCSTSAKSW